MRLAALAALIAAPAFAHDIQEITVSHWKVERSFVEILIDNTADGMTIYCAVYSSTHGLVGTGLNFGKPIATSVTVPTDYPAFVDSVRCAVRE